MNQLTLARWLKAIAAGMAVCGAAVVFVILPVFGKGFAGADPALAKHFLPWVILIVLTAIPCGAALLFFYRIAQQIGRDNSFSEKNAQYLKRISQLAVFDSTFFFAANVVYLLVGLSSIAVALIALILSFIGVAAAVASAALSHLVLKAAELRKENELTI